MNLGCMSSGPNVCQSSHWYDASWSILRRGRRAIIRQIGKYPEGGSQISEDLRGSIPHNIDEPGSDHAKSTLPPSSCALSCTSLMHVLVSHSHSALAVMPPTVHG
jgi:hypothetical protein